MAARHCPILSHGLGPMPHPVHVFCAITRRLTDFRAPVLPSLGDALAVHAAPAARVPELVCEALAAAPWCAVVLLTEQALSGTEVASLLRILPSIIVSVDGGLQAEPASITTQLRLRGAPSREELVGYLRRRGLTRGLIAAIEDALATRENQKVVRSPHPSSINRRLAAFGPLRAADWRALVGLLQFEAPASISAERAALEAGADPRTLRARTEELLGVSAHPALDTPGWEWKVEAALRRHGYVPWPAPTRRGSAGCAVPMLMEV